MATPFALDTSTSFGARVEQRLRDERIIWLTTVRDDGSPEPSPVWFWWDGREVLVYSEPGKLKVRNVERRPGVSLHFNCSDEGGNVVVFSGQAQVDPNAPSVAALGAYAGKYADGIRRIGHTPESMAATYSIPIRITLTRLRGH